MFNCQLCQKGLVCSKKFCYNVMDKVNFNRIVEELSRVQKDSVILGFELQSKVML